MDKLLVNNDSTIHIYYSTRTDRFYKHNFIYKYFEDDLK